MFRSFLFALCIAGSFASISSGTVAHDSPHSRSNFQHEWFAAATGLVTATNVMLTFGHQASPHLAFLGMGSALVLAATDDGKMSSALAATAMVAGILQAFGMEREHPRHEMSGQRLQLGVAPDFQRVLLQYRF